MNEEEPGELLHQMRGPNRRFCLEQQVLPGCDAPDADDAGLATILQPLRGEVDRPHLAERFRRLLVGSLHLDAAPLSGFDAQPLFAPDAMNRLQIHATYKRVDPSETIPGMFLGQFQNLLAQFRPALLPFRLARD